MSCIRCGGAGYISRFMYNQGGVCFLCQGSGIQNQHYGTDNSIKKTAYSVNQHHHTSILNSLKIDELENMKKKKKEERRMLLRELDDIFEELRNINDSLNDGIPDQELLGTYKQRKELLEKRKEEIRKQII